MDALIVETVARFTFNVLIFEENAFNVEILIEDVFILLAFNVFVFAVLTVIVDTNILLKINVLNRFKVFEVIVDVVMDDI